MAWYIVGDIEGTKLENQMRRSLRKRHVDGKRVRTFLWRSMTARRGTLKLRGQDYAFCRTWQLHFHPAQSWHNRHINGLAMVAVVMAIHGLKSMGSLLSRLFQILIPQILQIASN